MVISFCLNNLGSFGLGGSINSLIKHCSDSSSLRFYFLCSFVDKKIKKAILELLEEVNFDGAATFIDFDAEKEFGKYRSLQNDWTTYGRLLIPDLINEDQVLYLDTDLVIETDVLDIFRHNTEHFAIAAVPTTAIQYALEHKFFCNTLNVDPSLKVFNAGVLLMNNKAWRTNNIKKELMRIADRYPQELLSADQALLSAFFAGSFLRLPPKYNVYWYPDRQPAIVNDAIYHFLGSPKPWDFLGKRLHCGYAKWNQYNPLTWEKNVLRSFKVEQAKRSWAIKKSYLKLLLKK
jgi:lipopolysaccharide biosynthesis glycosyltransferase